MTLREIDWKLDMLHKYLEYRSEWIIQAHEEKLRIKSMFKDLVCFGYVTYRSSEGFKEPLLSFDRWLYRYLSVHGEPIKFD